MKVSGAIAALLCVLLALLALFSALLVGAVNIPLSDTVRLLLHPDESLHARILWDLRLPRVALAFLVGALLALAGVLMQALLQNPLADPYVLGTSGGAAFAVLAAMLLGLPLFALPLLAIVGAAVSTLLLFVVVGLRGVQAKQTLVLGGIVLTTAWAAGITYLLTTAQQSDLPGMLFWLIGDLSAGGRLLLPSLALLVLLPLAWLSARPLNLLLLGDRYAQSLGLNVARLRWHVVFLAIIATALAVAAAGPIGFVGLVAPHLLRLLSGSDHRWLIPNTALLGGTLVVGADILARVLHAPGELPVGIFTALLGVPVFLWLLRRQAQLQ
jgi:iron complex transport system permease protein